MPLQQKVNPFCLVLRGNQIATYTVLGFQSVRNLNLPFPISSSSRCAFCPPAQGIMTLFLEFVFLMQLWFWCPMLTMGVRKPSSPLGFSHPPTLFTDPTLNQPQIYYFLGEYDGSCNTANWFSMVSIQPVVIRHH